MQRLLAASAASAAIVIFGFLSTKPWRSRRITHLWLERHPERVAAALFVLWLAISLWLFVSGRPEHQKRDPRQMPPHE